MDREADITDDAVEFRVITDDDSSDAEEVVPPFKGRKHYSHDDVSVQEQEINV